MVISEFKPIIICFRNKAADPIISAIQSMTTISTILIH